jgi:ariadne-1
VPCDLAKAFISLDHTDTLTNNLIEALTKPCPKCGVRIEKNGQCVHMTCRHCKHDFCWLCKADWRGHAGSYYSCAKYNEDKKNNRLSEEQKQIQSNNAKLHKYKLYRASYDENAKCVTENISMIQKLDSCGIPMAKKAFLYDVIEKLSDAFRLLQWSYCLTYYLKESTAKKLFLHQQKALQDIAKQQQLDLKPFSNTSGESTLTTAVTNLCELDKRVEVLNRCNTLEKNRSSIIESLENGQLIEVILNNADDKNEEWACVLCSSSHNDSQMKCTKCGACRIHGEKECWGCNPR